MLDEMLLIELQQFIELRTEPIPLVSEPEYSYSCHSELLADEIEDFIQNRRMPAFQQLLFSHIDQKGLRDSDIYKKAGIDRRHFSKIRSNPNYRLSKNAAVTLAIALELNRQETDNLLSAAGFTLSDHDIFDLVIQFFIEKQRYDPHQINLALEKYDQKPLFV